MQTVPPEGHQLKPGLQATTLDHVVARRRHQGRLVRGLERNHQPGRAAVLRHVRDHGAHRAAGDADARRDGVGQTVDRVVHRLRADGVGEWAGFSTGWLYWYFWVIVVGFEAVVGGQMINKWIPSVPVWVIALGLMVIMTGPTCCRSAPSARRSTGSPVSRSLRSSCSWQCAACSSSACGRARLPTLEPHRTRRPASRNASPGSPLG